MLQRWVGLAGPRPGLAGAAAHLPLGLPARPHPLPLRRNLRPRRPRQPRRRRRSLQAAQLQEQAIPGIMMTVMMASGLAAQP